MGGEIQYLNVFDVRAGGIRIAACVGSLMRSFFAFFAHLPPFVAPVIEQISREAGVGGIGRLADGGPDEEMSKGGECEGSTWSAIYNN